MAPPGGVIDAVFSQRLAGETSIFPCQALAFLGTLAAGEIIASIGSIENFESAGKLKGLIGWHPVEDQSGKSRNDMVLAKSGK